MTPNLKQFNEGLQPRQNIEHIGSLLIKGNVDSYCVIIATGDIEVTGDVINSKIKSANGSIIIRGEVKGAVSQINACQDIIVKIAANAALKAGHNITIQESVIDAHLIAKNSIFLESNDGSIEGGETEAGKDIVSGIVGTLYKVPTLLKLSNFRQN